MDEDDAVTSAKRPVPFRPFREILSTIDLGNGHMGDWFFVYTITYETRLRGGTAQTISGGL